MVGSNARDLRGNTVKENIGRWHSAAYERLFSAELCYCESLQRNEVLWISSVKRFVKYPTDSSAVGLDGIAAAKVAATQLLHFLLPLVGPNKKLTLWRQKLLRNLETGAISLIYSLMVLLSLLLACVTPIYFWDPNLTIPSQDPFLTHVCLS